MLTEKDYCDYETCVALMELGYNKPSIAFYPCQDIIVDCIDSNGELYEAEYYKGNLALYSSLNNKNHDINKVQAPLLYEAQKWLREEKHLHIEVYACAGGYIGELCKAYETTTFSGGTTIYTQNNTDDPKLNDAGKYDYYEDALLEEIKKAVKTLTNNKNE